MHAYGSVLFVGKLKIYLPVIKEKSRRKELQERLDTREKQGKYNFYKFSPKFFHYNKIRTFFLN